MVSLFDLLRLRPWRFECQVVLIFRHGMWQGCSDISEVCLIWPPSQATAAAKLGGHVGPEST